MSAFAYKAGRLWAEEVDLARLAAEAGTPLYVYSAAALREHFRTFADACPPGSLVAYAVKANGNLAVLSQVHSNPSIFEQTYRDFLVNFIVLDEQHTRMAVSRGFENRSWLVCLHSSFVAA